MPNLVGFLTLSYYLLKEGGFQKMSGLIPTATKAGIKISVTWWRKQNQFTKYCGLKTSGTVESIQNVNQMLQTRESVSETLWFEDLRRWTVSRISVKTTVMHLRQTLLRSLNILCFCYVFRFVKSSALLQCSEFLILEMPAAALWTTILL